MPSRSIAFTPLRIAHRALWSALLLRAGLALLVGAIFAAGVALLPRLWWRALAPGAFAPRAASG